MAGIIFGYAWTKDGIVPVDSFAAAPDKGFVWLHLDRNEPETQAYLEKASRLPAMVTKELLSPETRPRLLPYEGGVFICLRGLNLHHEQKTQDMIVLHLWVEEHRMMTMQSNEHSTIEAMHNKILHQKAPAKMDELLLAIITDMTVNISETIADMIDRVDELEDHLLDFEQQEIRSTLVIVRRQVIQIQRYLLPQSDVLFALLSTPFPWMRENQRLFLRENQEKLLRGMDELEMIRERAMLIQEEIMSQHQEAMNRTVYLLSVAGAIFLPLTFLTGLFGINVGGIPGAQDGRAFVWFALTMLLVGVLEYLFLKRRHWF